MSAHVRSSIYLPFNSFGILPRTSTFHLADGHPPPDRTEEKPVLRHLSMGLFLSMCGLAAIGIMAGVCCLIFNIINKNRRYFLLLLFFAI